MPRQHAPSHDPDAGFFERRAPQGFIDEPVHHNPCPANTTACDPKDPFHSRLWAHEVDPDSWAAQQRAKPDPDPFSPQGLTRRLDDGLRRVDISKMAHMAAGTAEVGFRVGDYILAHGGQVALDAAGFVPGLNVVTEGVQSGYHLLHAGVDAYQGHSESAHRELGESIWHGASAGVNWFTAGRGGKALESAHEAGGAKQMIENVHNIVDAHEAAWDMTSSAVGDDERLPFFGGIVPWAIDGAGRGESHHE